MTDNIVNVDQASAWNGASGAHWVETEDQHNAALRPHGARLIAAAAITATDDVLDIGCGTGESTRAAARDATKGTVLGVDLSRAMLERARARVQAEGLANVRFEQADAQVHQFEPQTRDLVISRFGAMFFNDPVAAYTNLRRALRPGGRIALLVWQAPEHNPWMTAVLDSVAAGRTGPRPAVGAPGPFGLADPEPTRRILTDAGYRDVAFEDVRAPFTFGASHGEAFAFASNLGMARTALQELDEETKARALDELSTALGRAETSNGVRFDSAAWIIGARRA